MTSPHDPISRTQLGLADGLPLLVPLVAAAAHLHLSVRTVRRWISAGRLQALRTTPGGSGRLLIPREELVRELERMRECRYGGDA